MSAHGRTVDKVADERVRCVAETDGNWTVMCLQAFPFAVSRWGSANDAAYHARHLKLWLMGILMEDRKQR